MTATPNDKPHPSDLPAEAGDFRLSEAPTLDELVLYMAWLDEQPRLSETDDPDDALAESWNHMVNSRGWR